MEINSAPAGPAALRLHRRNKLASKKHFPPHFISSTILVICFSLQLYALQWSCISTPLPSLYLLFSYDPVIQLIILSHGAWKIMTFFSLCRCYKTWLHVVLLRWHREMRRRVVHLERVSKFCLAPGANFPPGQRSCHSRHVTGLEELRSESGRSP